MTTHLQRELDTLKDTFMKLVELVENTIGLAAKSLNEMDRALAEKIIEADDAIDQMEIKIEEDCLKLLALYQPVAVDLRFIVAILKINNDLERIADLGVNIAKRVVILSTQKVTIDTFDFPIMLDKVSIMLSKSLDALVRRDTELAKEVRALDREVDILKSKIEEKVIKELQTHPEQVPAYLCILSTCRHLERIADHATNIAEDVIYMVDGAIIRHRSYTCKNPASSN